MDFGRVIERIEAECKCYNPTALWGSNCPTIGPTQRKRQENTTIYDIRCCVDFWRFFIKTAGVYSLLAKKYFRGLMNWNYFLALQLSFIYVPTIFVKHTHILLGPVDLLPADSLFAKNTSSSHWYRHVRMSFVESNTISHPFSLTPARFCIAIWLDTYMWVRVWVREWVWVWIFLSLFFVFACVCVCVCVCVTAAVWN